VTKEQLDEIRAQAEAVKYAPEIDLNVWCLLDTDIPALLDYIARLEARLKLEMSIRINSYQLKTDNLISKDDQDYIEAEMAKLRE
jgi:hypothetical protein